ncbi:MAG: T9SS type A sorting domain-containing protein [Flavobacteriales bacterium]|nr:T9SS type A sorting domain-containing protein [Flavobacteriales bacterium]
MKYNRLVRSVKYRLKQYLEYIKTGQWKQFSNVYKNKFLRSLKRDLNLLRWRLNTTTLKCALGGSLYLFSVAISRGQNFAPVTVNPFGLGDTTKFLKSWDMNFVDLDNDGDLDLFSLDFYEFPKALYTENIGTTQNPIFDTTKTNPFGLIPRPFSYKSDLADFDNDGDLDIISGSYDYTNNNDFTGLTYRENLGTTSNANFGQPLDIPFGIDSGYYSVYPTVVDLDNDGDFDLIVGAYYGVLEYYENTGTASSPNFGLAQKNPFGLDSASAFAMPTTVDIDSDGDFDVFVAEYYGAIRYFENIGSASNPAFGAPVMNPFGINPASIQSYISNIEFADIDGDGDQDLFMTAYYDQDSCETYDLYFFENISPPATIDDKPNSNEIGLRIFPSPSSERVQFSEGLKEFYVRDILGQLVYKESSNVTSKEFDVSKLSPGVYKLEGIDLNDSHRTGSFIKK